MTAHVHAWAPADGVMGRYTCACGAFGQRPRAGGAIVELRAKRRPWWAPQPAATAGTQDWRQDFGGRAPTLDEQERR